MSRPIKTYQEFWKQLQETEIIPNNHKKEDQEILDYLISNGILKKNEVADLQEGKLWGIARTIGMVLMGKIVMTGSKIKATKNLEDKIDLLATLQTSVGSLAFMATIYQSNNAKTLGQLKNFGKKR